MHFPVYYSDLRSREIVDTNLEIKKKLIDLFGSEIYINDKLNRPMMASLIFSNEELKLKVNSIIHPKVRDDFKEWMLNQKTDLIFNEAALFMENGSYQKFDATVLVLAPQALRIQRIQKRDNLSVKEIEARINSQWSDEKKMALTPFHIINDEHHPLLSQVEELVDKLKMI